MGKKSKTPEAPNYTAIAQQQQQLGQQAWSTALNANRPNQTNQFGSLTWSQDPTTGQWTQSSQLNQPQQDIFNQQQANQQQIANMGGGMLGGFDTSQVDLSNAPKMPGMSDYNSLGQMPGQVDYGSLGGIPQVGQYSQQATDLYRQLMAPQLEQQRSAAEAKLAAMGLNTGSGKAWENAQRAIGTNENQANLQAAQAGISQGNAMFGQGMQGYQQGVQNLNNNWQQAMSGRQQGVSELNNQFTQGMGLHNQGAQDILNQKQANLGQISGMMGLGQQMAVPQFNSFQGMQPYNVADLTGAAQNQYQGQLDQYNAKKSSSGGLLGTIGGIAGSFLGPVGGAVGSAIGKSIGG